MRIRERGIKEIIAIIVIITALIGSGSLSSAEAWTQDGDVTIHGKVGIGTETPFAPVDIQGTTMMIGSEEGGTRSGSGSGVIYARITSLSASDYSTPVGLLGYTGGNNNAVQFGVAPLGGYGATAIQFCTYPTATSAENSSNNLLLKSNYNKFNFNNQDIDFQIDGATNDNVFFVDAATEKVGIGTATPDAKLNVNGDGHITGSLTVDGNIAAKYQDLAEWVMTTEPLTPGTVVMIDVWKVDHVSPSDAAYNTLVAGVVSPQPGIMLGEPGDNKAVIAHTGRVRVKVDTSNGAISTGDLLVTSPVKGHAMRSDPVDIGGVRIHRPGTIIGKALEPLAEGQQGEVLALITLQ